MVTAFPVRARRPDDDSGGIAAPGPVTAVLGPTNTGKTHFAIERMLGHRSGVIGLPLRLLAREVYDRVVRAKGADAAALITGEEKIIGRAARYFVCTVEAMPLDRSFEFLGIDEIQLCDDPERGHVFTQRLLAARGSGETLFLGAATMRRMIKALVPQVQFITRPRLSTLAYAGHTKLLRLPRRSAVVAFSAQAVYALAEAIRRQRGGAAVVLGALSPRTRNAQVALFEAGEVDYIVATDAIGMGLNLGVDHVAFASFDKFDGRRHRMLSPSEIGQIAGRAGRAMRDGTFGTTAGAEALEPEMVERIENHAFEPVRALQWRNPDLDLSSVDALLAALDRPPPAPGLSRVREADDQAALKALSQDEAVRGLARGRERVSLLWQVAQVPDFRKTMADVHVRLLTRIFIHLAKDGRLPPAWAADQLARIDNVEGDMDMLAARLAHIRTWTFIAHRADWLDRPEEMQARARAIEDRLSDALHERLTQRFVDRRSASLIRHLAGSADLLGAVNSQGDVLVEGEYVGRMSGLKFAPDPQAEGPDGKAVLAAAHRALGPEVARRTDELETAPDSAFALDADGRVAWGQDVLGRLVPGRDVLHPRVQLGTIDLVDGTQRERILKRLEAFVAARIEAVLGPLLKLSAGEGLPAPVRGLAYRLAEALGALPRKEVAREVEALGQPDRAGLRQLGVRFGKLTIYVPALLKPEATQTKLLLRAAFQGTERLQAPPPGLVSIPLDGTMTDDLLAIVGFRRCGARAVRIDMLERLDQALRAKTEELIAPVGELTGLVGASNEEFVAVMRALGYEKLTQEDGSIRYRARARRGSRRPAPQQPQPQAIPAAPPPEGEAAPAEAAEGASPPPAEAAVPVPAPAGAARAPGDKHKKPPRRDRPADERRPPRKPDGRPPRVDPDSPFAALAALKDGRRG